MNLKNDNEFDNLFRRAADNFPLNTNSSDWESVLAKLEEKEEKKAFVLINKRLLVLLLCILFVCGLTVLGLLIAYKNNEKHTDIVVVNSNNEFKRNQSLENTIGDAVYKKIVDSLKKQQITDSVNNAFSNQNATGKHLNNKQLAKSINTTKNQLLHSSSNLFVKAKPFENKIFMDVNKNNNLSAIDVSEVDTNHQNSVTTIASSVLKIVPDTNKTAAKNTDTAVVDNLTSNTKKKDIKAKFFYAGLMYATDKSALNFEKNKGQGYSLAMVLGYQCSRLFSIETGVHIEKKEYYTTGEHFNKSIIPATGKVNWIEAENKLIEIPITLKYNFFTKKRHQFFATTGLSSYLVNSEYYEYEEEVGGIRQDGSVFYEKNTSNLFATYNFSVGYLLHVKKIGNFRIEPYINLPLKGTGLGNEPVISRGIYLGWIYNFKK